MARQKGPKRPQMPRVIGSHHVKRMKKSIVIVIATGTLNIWAAPVYGRETVLLEANRVCWVRTDRTVSPDPIVSVQVSTRTGFWSIGAPLDGRRHPVSKDARNGAGATWSPRDREASGIKPKQDSNLVYLEAVLGTVTASKLQSASDDFDLPPGAVRARISTEGLLLEDGTRIGTLAAVEMTCARPRLDGAPEQAWPFQERRLPEEAYQLAIFSDASPRSPN